MQTCFLICGLFILFSFLKICLFYRISSNFFKKFKKRPAYYWRRRGMRMFEIDRTPIYRIFLKKVVFWCPVSGIYIPIPFLTGHHRTPEKQKRCRSIKNRTPLKLKFTDFLQFCCPVVSGL